MITVNPPIFKGIATALITPFKNGSIDFAAMKRLIEIQIESGIAALVVCGTTGEASTLSEKEQASLIDFTVKQVDGRIPVIAGSGNNCTKKTIELSLNAEAMGADALLIVTPYYNKASSEGLLRHYLAIADSVSTPIILYNVPLRTGVDIPFSVYEKLSAHSNIRALKEARGNTETVKKLMSEKIPLHIYSGNDSTTCDMLDDGALGCISVSSNIIPRGMAKICDLYFSGAPDSAKKLEAHLSSFYDAMFCEVNPIPVKYAMSLLGLCSCEMRLPLCPPSAIISERIISTMKEYGII